MGPLVQKDRLPPPPLSPQGFYEHIVQKAGAAGNIDIHVLERRLWQQMVADNNVHAWVCLSLPDGLCLKRPPPSPRKITFMPLKHDVYR